MAQAYYNHYTETTDASSSGTDPTTPDRYPNLDDLVCEVMLEGQDDIPEGLDLRQLGHSVKYITSDMVKKADQIYVLCSKDQCPNYLIDKKLIDSCKVIFWDIQDPYGYDIGYMRKIRDQIKEKVLSII